MIGVDSNVLTMAEAQSDSARTRLAATASALRSRLAPASLAADGAEILTDRANIVIDQLAGSASRHKLGIAGGAALAAAAVALIVKSGRGKGTGRVLRTRKLTVGQVANAVIIVARVASAIRSARAARSK